MRSQYIRSGNGFVLVYAVTSKYAGVSPFFHYFELIAHAHNTRQHAHAHNRESFNSLPSFRDQILRVKDSGTELDGQHAKMFSVRRADRSATFVVRGGCQMDIRS